MFPFHFILISLFFLLFIAYYTAIIMVYCVWVYSSYKNFPFVPYNETHRSESTEFNWNFGPLNSTIIFRKVHIFFFSVFFMYIYNKKRRKKCFTSFFSSIFFLFCSATHNQSKCDLHRQKKIIIFSLLLILLFFSFYFTFICLANEISCTCSLVFFIQNIFRVAYICRIYTVFVTFHVILFDFIILWTIELNNFFCCLLVLLFSAIVFAFIVI